VIEFEFLNKFCKIDHQSECCGSWAGLGFQFLCNCTCHEEKKEVDENWTCNSTAYNSATSDVTNNPLMCKPNKMSDKRSTKVNAL
jgi:hypothetical protein